MALSRQFAITAILTAAATFGAPQSASALCSVPNGPQQGTYENIDSDTRSITRMRVRYVCGAERSNNDDGSGTIRHGGDPHWEVALWGSCSPTDCEWGPARATMRERGAYLSARYDQGFAQRTVRIYPTSRDDRLRLRLRSTYSDDRSPRTSENTMQLR